MIMPKIKLASSSKTTVWENYPEKSSFFYLNWYLGKRSMNCKYEPKTTTQKTKKKEKNSRNFIGKKTNNKRNNKNLKQGEKHKLPFEYYSM